MRPMPELTVEEASTDELIPYANNAKIHTNEQVEQICTSIQEFGFNDPVAVWDGPDGPEIIEGHGRVLAAKRLGLEKLPVIRLDHLDDAQRRAYTHVHNQLTMNTGWDFSTLDADLAELDFDFSAFGFDVEDEQLFDGIDESADELPDMDDSEPVSKHGQIWRLGDHLLMCGDSTDKSDVSKLMGGMQADLLLTDPPYNVDITGDTKDNLKIANDDFANDAEFVEFLRKALDAASNETRPGGAFYIWYASTQSSSFLAAASEAHMQIRQILTWVKSTFSLGRQDYQWQHEPCLYGWVGGASHRWYGGRKQATVFDDARPADLSKLTKAELVQRCSDLQDAMETEQTDVLRFPKPAASREHPTMKPVKLIARLIANSSMQGDVVLDPFAGSGTTLVACEQMGRRCRTMELDPHYCDVIIRRWEDFTGKKAELSTE